MASYDLTPARLSHIVLFSITLAREAGKLILEGSDAIARSASVGDVEEKKNSVDLVTQYDRAVEKLVRERTAEAFPEFGFIGEEETSALGKLPELTDGPIFCVDPIDGTTNFVHGFPFACISIGLIYKKRPILGVIFNPFVDWLYYGAQSLGAYLIKCGMPHKLPLAPPRPLPSLSQALIAVEWGSDRGLEAMKSRADSFQRLAGDGKQVERGKMAHSLRSMGSAALNFAAVASGSLDMYWEIGCWPWDVCAGTIIAQEAGGIVNTSDLSLHGGEVTGDMSDKVLTGRKYIVMRAIADSPTEKGVDTQRRLIKEFCDTVEDFTPN